MKYRIIAFSLAATLSTLVAPLSPGTADAAVQACPHIPSGGGETVEGFVQANTGACTVTNNSYIRKSVSYKIDVHATTGGTCTLRHAELNGSCTVDGVQMRGVGGMRVDAVAGPTGPPYPHNIPPTMFPNNGSGQWTQQDQDVDSRVTGSILGSSPLWTPLYNGQWTLQFKNNIYLTNCLMTPNNIVSTWTLHVLDCKPEWYISGNPGVNFHAPPTGNIQIVIPSAAFEDARIPAQQAAADWAAALGRNITVAPGYGSCAINDPLCVGLRNDHGTKDDDPVGCASFGTASYDSSGAWTGTTNVRFEPNWTGGHPDNLRETIAHELGHYFGLDNRLHSSCTAGNTIMGSSGCYATQAPPAGTALGPTVGDISPLIYSTYGNQVRNACGW